MRHLALATGAAIVALGFATAGAAAAATVFSYDGVIDTFVVSTSGDYHLEAAGAPGGSSSAADIGQGSGAFVSGDVYLSAGVTLSILVGGAGSNDGGGNGSGGSGGGMSFIALGSTPLLVAGGAGGADWFIGIGGDGRIGDSGSGAGGGGGGGAGWLSSGLPADSADTQGGSGGLSSPSFAGGAGYVGDPDGPAWGPGSNGGFGGGGGAGYDFGGGGGGYTGGESGALPDGSGSGGTSFVAAEFTNVVEVAGGGEGQQFVSIDLLAVPEPSTWLALLTGFIGVGATMRFRRRIAAGA
jgi:hypothetical protein